MLARSRVWVGRVCAGGGLWSCGAVELKLGKAETATIYTKGGSTDFVVDAVAMERSEANFWGQVKATDAW